MGKIGFLKNPYILTNVNYPTNIMFRRVFYMYGDEASVSN